MKQNILHSTLTRGPLLIMASDMVSEQGLRRGNAVSLMLHCSSEEEIKTCYARLCRGGQATHPLENTFWGALFGDLVDKFGNHWLLNYDKPESGKGEAGQAVNGEPEQAVNSTKNGQNRG
jgi:PhnB protein